MCFRSNGDTEISQLEWVTLNVHKYARPFILLSSYELIQVGFEFDFGYFLITQAEFEEYP